MLPEEESELLVDETEYSESLSYPTQQEAKQQPEEQLQHRAEIQYIHLQLTVPS